MEDPLQALVWLIAFIFSVSCHEGAHALAAYWGGDRTAYNAGQVSLSPLPHARREPFGMLVMPLLTAFSWGFPIGWASTPYDPAWEERHPRRAAWMAAAGPAANFALAAVALVALRVGLTSDLFQAPDTVNFARVVVADGQVLDNIGRFLSMMLVLNVILGVFNLLPVPPLDGASVITLLLPEHAGQSLKEALRNPGLALIGLLAAWYLFGRMIYPIWSALLVLVHPEVRYG